ncbi:hypothetical protein L3Q82_001546 [Scortum barcoo]|uniref:Uncharacterized protein n=1 Tax=Scortum barcoo TaxID=214431 RepID=A0ACB8W7T1_9TELE|nr:hypothetical protein L3Q82_001546 [Scortum barcoo]
MTLRTPGECGMAYGPSLATRQPPPACGNDTDFLNDLNNFFRRFEALNSTPAEKEVPLQEETALCLASADVRRTLKRVKTCKAPGPDNIPGRVLRECADQLACVLTDIFNTSLSQAKVPTCSKAATIIPVPKKTHITSLNDYRPVALTPIMMKCFERLGSATNHIVKFADDTTVVGLIRDDNDLAYREEVEQLVRWCEGNNLILNVDKTKEIIVDFRKIQPSHAPLLINNSAVEVVSSTKFLGVHITDDLTCGR